MVSFPWKNPALLFTLICAPLGAKTLHELQSNTPVRIGQGRIINRDWETGDMYLSSQAQFDLTAISDAKQPTMIEAWLKHVSSKTPSLAGLSADGKEIGDGKVQFEVVNRVRFDGKLEARVKFRASAMDIDAILDTTLNPTTDARITVSPVLIDSENLTRARARDIFAAIKPIAFDEAGLSKRSATDRIPLIANLLSKLATAEELAELFNAGTPFSRSEWTALVDVLASGFVATGTRFGGNIVLNDDQGAANVYRVMRASRNGMSDGVGSYFLKAPSKDKRCEEGYVFLQSKIQRVPAWQNDEAVAEADQLRFKKLKSIVQLAKPLEGGCFIRQSEIRGYDYGYEISSFGFLQTKAVMPYFKDAAGKSYTYVWDETSPAINPIYVLKEAP